MAKEPYLHHISSIFQALDVGLDGLTDAPGNSFKEVSYVPPEDETIEPDKFNRADVVIDGHRYTVSIFRPRPTEGVLDFKQPYKMIGPVDEAGQSWAVQGGQIYGWSESNSQFEAAWWLLPDGRPNPDLANQGHIQAICAQRPFDPEWLKEEGQTING